MRALSANLHEVMIPIGEEEVTDGTGRISIVDSGFRWKNLNLEKLNNKQSDNVESKKEEYESRKDSGNHGTRSEQKSRPISLSEDYRLLVSSSSTSLSGTSSNVVMHQEKSEQRIKSGGGYHISHHQYQQQQQQQQHMGINPHDPSYSSKKNASKKQLENMSIVGAFIRAGASDEEAMEKILSRSSSAPVPFSPSQSSLSESAMPSPSNYEQYTIEVRSATSNASVDVHRSTMSSNLSVKTTSNPKKWNDPAFAAKKKANVRFFGSELSLYASLFRLGVDCPTDADGQANALNGLQSREERTISNYRDSSVDTENLAFITSGSICETFGEGFLLSPTSSPRQADSHAMDEKELYYEILRLDAEFEERVSFKIKYTMMMKFFLLWKEGALVSKMEKINKSTSKSLAKSSSKRRVSSESLDSPKKATPLQQPSFIEILQEGQKLRVPPRPQRTNIGRKKSSQNHQNQQTNILHGHKHNPSQDSALSLSTIQSEDIAHRTSKDSLIPPIELNFIFHNEYVDDVDQYPREDSAFTFDLNDEGEQPELYNPSHLIAKSPSKVSSTSSSKNKRKIESEGMPQPSTMKDGNPRKSGLSGIFSWGNTKQSKDIPPLPPPSISQRASVNHSSSTSTDLTKSKRSSRSRVSGVFSRLFDSASSSILQYAFGSRKEQPSSV